MPAAQSRLVCRIRWGPRPHGDGDGVNFAIFGGSAEQVYICLFDPSGTQELRRVRYPNAPTACGMATSKALGRRSGTACGRTAPYEPERGHRYNVNKLLVDPYARALSGTVRWSEALFGYRMASPRADLSFDRRDSAADVPKSVVTSEQFDWGADRAPRVAWADTVIYETHLRGLTMRLPGIPEAQTRYGGGARSRAHHRLSARAGDHGH